jgi:hypothetical protein
MIVDCKEQDQNKGTSRLEGENLREKKVDMRNPGDSGGGSLRIYREIKKFPAAVLFFSFFFCLVLLGPFQSSGWEGPST